MGCRQYTQTPELKNYLNNNQIMTILWLDDLRNPFLDVEGRVPPISGTIEWVLNYEEFVMWITKKGIPDVVSFDHDLADEHYVPEKYWRDYQLSKEYQEKQVHTEKTGKDCANWLVAYCMDRNLPLPKWFVHSANPVGADNIIGLLRGYDNYYKQKQTTK